MMTLIAQFVDWIFKLLCWDHYYDEYLWLNSYPIRIMFSVTQNGVPPNDKTVTSDFFGVFGLFQIQLLAKYISGFKNVKDIIVYKDHY